MVKAPGHPIQGKPGQAPAAAGSQRLWGRIVRQDGDGLLEANASALFTTKDVNADDFLCAILNHDLAEDESTMIQL